MFITTIAAKNSRDNKIKPQILMAFRTGSGHFEHVKLDKG